MTTLILLDHVLIWQELEEHCRFKNVEMYIIGYLIIAILKLFSIVIDLCIILIVVNAISSWFLGAYRSSLLNVVNRLVEPVLRPIRNFLPSTSIDLSPVVTILILYFIKEFFIKVLIKFGESLL